MKLFALLLSILLINTTSCQRRGPWRGLPPRRLPPCIEERLRRVPNIPNRAPEVPVVNRIAEVPGPCNKIEGSTLEAVAKLAQNIPRDIPVPTTDYYQNVLLSPNRISIPSQIVPSQIVPNQMVPNQIVPNQMVSSQLIPTGIPSYQVPMQNVQYFQNVIPKPQDVPEIPVVEVPRVEKIFVQIEPEKSCPCKQPSNPNPFLPAASPVSPWMASNLPSATSQARSHFLRKIPIPPPTL